MCCITYKVSLHYGLLVGNFVHRRVVDDGRTGEWAPQPSEHYQLMILVRLLVSTENQMGKEKAILPMFVSLWCLTFVTKTNKKRGGRDSTKRLLLTRWVSELQFWHLCNRIQSHPSEWLQMPGVWALRRAFFFFYVKFFSLEKTFAPLGQNIVISISKAPLKFLR